jgi:hypothetical protein
MDVGAWVGIIALALAIPLGVISAVLSQPVLRYLKGASW